MLRPASAFATHPDEFVPRVIALDVSRDSLATFASEKDMIAPPARTAVLGRGPAGPRPIRIRFPKWIDHAGLAIVGAALSCMVIVASPGSREPSAAPATGTILVSSEPAGAAISVDGVARGTTPYSMTAAPGSHLIEVRSGGQTRTRRLRVSAGGEASMHVAWPVRPAVPVAPSETTGPSPAPAAASRVVAAAPALPTPPAPAVAREVAPAPRVSSHATFRPVPSGWLSLSSPFTVRVFEDGVELGDSGDRLPLAAGSHTLTLVNEPLEFRETRAVTVEAKRTTALAIEPPAGTLHVNAQPWATVWIDGRRAGETPIGNLSLPIGLHEIVLRHPQLGEQQTTVLVGARTPARVGVEFRP